MSEPSREEAWSDFRVEMFEKWLQESMGGDMEDFENFFQEVLEGDLRVGEE